MSFLFKKKVKTMVEPQEILDNNEYHLVRKIATGGMGDVYEALQLGIEGFAKRVVIKTLVEELAADNSFVQMFIGEAKLVADLIHENIAQVYQLGKINNTFYIAMEYIHGVTLQEFQERHLQLSKKIPIELCCFIISRVCRALHYAHTKRDRIGELLCIVHRDVSPNNIMLALDSVVKLTDFGIAKARDFMFDGEGEILYGKVPYMSPEQASFQKTDGRSDIFSLGICFYEILTGEALYSKGDKKTLMTRYEIIKDAIPPIREKRPDIPAKVEEILLRALEKRRHLRYQTAQKMCLDLEHFLYDKGYGPTNDTLVKYLKTIFPEKA